MIIPLAAAKGCPRPIVPEPSAGAPEEHSQQFVACRMSMSLGSSLGVRWGSRIMVETVVGMFRLARTPSPSQ